MTQLQDMERDIRAEVREEAAELLADQYAEDRIFEMVDGSVPVYNAEILEVISEEPSLWNEEPELGPAFDGSPTPVNIAASIIFDHLHGAAMDELTDIRDEAEEEEVSQDA